MRFLGRPATCTCGGTGRGGKRGTGPPGAPPLGGRFGFSRVSGPLIRSVLPGDRPRYTGSGVTYNTESRALSTRSPPHLRPARPYISAFAELYHQIRPRSRRTIVLIAGNGGRGPLPSTLGRAPPEAGRPGLYVSETTRAGPAWTRCERSDSVASRTRDKSTGQHPANSTQQTARSHQQRYRKPGR